jgi:hypothetical protein
MIHGYKVRIINRGLKRKALIKWIDGIKYSQLQLTSHI